MVGGHILGGGEYYKASHSGLRTGSEALSRVLLSVALSTAGLLLPRPCWSRGGR